MPIDDCPDLPRDRSHLTTTPCAPAQSLASPVELLRTCVLRLYQGPWQFIQLRGRTFHEVEFNGEDVDLLGTEESLERLVDAAFEWTRAQECHFRLIRRNDRKANLTLYSTDGTCQLQLDVWIRLPQIDRGRQSLTFQGVPQEARFSIPDPVSHTESDSMLRLNTGTEAMLYVHHLICRKKDIGSDRVQQRLRDYAARFLQHGQQCDAAIMTRVLECHHVDEQIEAESLKRLCDDLILHATPRTRLCRLRDWWLNGFSRSPRLIAIIGCDGAGKTTLAQSLPKQMPGRARHIVGKHLYRKSLLHKALVIVLRPLLCRTREQFDEMLAPLNYLIASIRLRLLRMFHMKSTLIFDRCLSDFLYLNRKSDQPRFSRWFCITHCIGLRPTIVHLLVRPEVLNGRRREVTSAGHNAYDEDFRNHIARRVPTDYIVISNNVEAEVTDGVVVRILRPFPQKKPGLAAKRTFA